MDIRNFYSSKGNLKKTNTTSNTTKSTNMASNQLVTYPPEVFPTDESDDSDGEQADYITHLNKQRLETTGYYFWRRDYFNADYETSEELRARDKILLLFRCRADGIKYSRPGSFFATGYIRDSAKKLKIFRTEEVEPDEYGIMPNPITRRWDVSVAVACGWDFPDGCLKRSGAFVYNAKKPNMLSPEDLISKIYINMEQKQDQKGYLRPDCVNYDEYSMKTLRTCLAAGMHQKGDGLRSLLNRIGIIKFDYTNTKTHGTDWGKFWRPVAPVPRLKVGDETKKNRAMATARFQKRMVTKRKAPPQRSAVEIQAELTANAVGTPTVTAPVNTTSSPLTTNPGDDYMAYIRQRQDTIEFQQRVRHVGPTIFFPQEAAATPPPEVTVAPTPKKRKIRHADTQIKERVSPTPWERDMHEFSVIIYAYYIEIRTFDMLSMQHVDIKHWVYTGKTEQSLVGRISAHNNGHTPFDVALRENPIFKNIQVCEVAYIVGKDKQELKTLREEAEWHWICTLKTHKKMHGHLNPYAMNTITAPNTSSLTKKWRAELDKISEEEEDVQQMMMKLKQRESNLKEKLMYL
jgi:hypothetical protein